MSNGGANQGAARVRAVVWRAPDSPTPADLIAALARQGILWEEAVGPFDALARLVASRARDPGGRALLLVEPTGLSGVDEVRRAVERFDPATACWGYRVGESPRLARLAPFVEPKEPQVVVRPRSATPVPKLRLAGEPSPSPTQAQTPVSNHAEDGAAEPPDPQSPRSILTPEELEMLLADDRG